MSNLFAALTPMPTNPVRAGVLLPETSQADGEELAALFAGVLATMMPSQAASDELPEQALLDLPQSDVELPAQTSPPQANLAEAVELPEATENTLAVFAQMPSLATMQVSTATDEAANKPNNAVAVVMGPRSQKPQALQSREPAAVMPSTASDVVDEAILSQLPIKPLTQAMSAAPVRNDTQQQPVISLTSVTGKPVAPTISNGTQDAKEVANIQLSNLDVKVAEAAITGLNNKPVMATSVPTTSATATVVSVPVSIHNERAFSEAFGLQLVKLAAQGITHATVRINPQELGPIDVRIVMNGQQAAQVDFQARQAQTADLLETMMPRLVSAMEAQGIRLDDARVSTMSAADAQSFAQQFGRQGQEAQADTQARGQGRTTVSAEAQSDDSVPEKTQPRPDSPPGRIDYYA